MVPASVEGSMNYQTSRRTFLAGAAGAVATMSGGRRVHAAGGQIVVANWGGDWNDRTVEFFEAPLVEKAGYTVVRDLDGTDQRVTKVIANRRLPRGPLDVVHADDAMAFEMNALDAIETIDEASVPRLKDVVQALRTPSFVPWLYSGWVLGYNPDKVKDAPKSFSDMWDPKYKGMIGLSDAHWYHHMEVAALQTGKTLDNIDVAAIKASMLEMKKATNPKLYPNHLQLQQGLKNEEVVVATNYKARLLLYAANGANVVPVYPSEGGIAIVFGLVMPKRGPDPDGGKFYCNALLDPDGLVAIAQKSFYSPSNVNSLLPEAATKTIAFNADEQKALHGRPHAFWLKNRNELLEWWNKEFKS
jgi:putative spermidine/putrescine transport system substrate-binding protein